eukprot:7377346-Prymnesium_polylepis.1
MRWSLDSSTTIDVFYPGTGPAPPPSGAVGCDIPGGGAGAAAAHARPAQEQLVVAQVTPLRRSRKSAARSWDVWSVGSSRT